MVGDRFKYALTQFESLNLVLDLLQRYAEYPGFSLDSPVFLQSFSEVQFFLNCPYKPCGVPCLLATSEQAILALIGHDFEL